MEVVHKRHRGQYPWGLGSVKNTIGLSGPKLGFWNYFTLTKAVTHDARSREQRADRKWGGGVIIDRETGMLVFPCFQLRPIFQDGSRVHLHMGLSKFKDSGKLVYSEAPRTQDLSNAYM